MKGWFLGEEVESFKPLRHVLRPYVLDKITIKEEIKKLINLEDIKRKGFIDPNYPNKIRIEEKIIEMEEYEVSHIFPLDKSSIEQGKEDIVKSKYFKEFAKDRSLSLGDKYKDRKGFNLSWIQDDLKEKGVFLKSNGENLIFKTLYFSYEIDKDFFIQNILFEEDEVKEIQWKDDTCGIIFEDNTINTIKGEYIPWFSYLNSGNKISWYYYANVGERVWDFISSIEYKIIIHPKVWEVFRNICDKDETYLKKLWMDDLKLNGVFYRLLNSKTNDCIINGWRFMYVWDGIILKEVLTPEGKSVNSLVTDNQYLYVNKVLKTELKKDKPQEITDLIPGNFMSMIPRNRLNRLEILPHATQRYEQRVDETAYMCEISPQIHSDIYSYGIVVDGAHTTERRKVETKKFGYILSNSLIVSVWRKSGYKKRKKKKRIPTSVKRVEKMKKIFDKLNDNKAL